MRTDGFWWGMFLALLAAILICAGALYMLVTR